ncbi:MAG TPA: hypothetical protein VLA45_16935, partial [Paracoccaceae bacterium]|nr:hypothetical protein [Paracoccaceae bacterium]
RDRLRLDRRRFGDALFGKGGNQAGREAQHIEIHEDVLFVSGAFGQAPNEIVPLPRMGKGGKRVAPAA